jgi:copper transport protein
VVLACWLLNAKYSMARSPVLGAPHVAASAALAFVSRSALGAAPLSAPLTTPALWLTGAERWLLLSGLSIALGGLAGRGLARQYLARKDTPAAPSPLPAPWALRGSLIGFAATAALLVTALAGPGVAAILARPPVAGLGPGATSEIAAAELACFALAALLLRLRQAGWSVLPLLGVVLAEGIRAHPEGLIPVAGALLTYCHLLPAVLWVGMLVYTTRAGIAWRAHPRFMKGLFRLYGTAAAWLFAVVVITGLVSALLLVPVGSLLTTTYGRFLIAKAALVAVAAGLAVAGRAGLRRPAEPGSVLPIVTRLEIGVLAAVLAATGLLTAMTPPAKPVVSAAAPPTGPAPSVSLGQGAAPRPVSVPPFTPMASGSARSRSRDDLPEVAGREHLSLRGRA